MTSSSIGHQQQASCTLDKLIPRSFVVSKIASTFAKQFLTPSSKGSHKRRRNSIKHVNCVAKEAKLSDRDDTVLFSAVNCCGKFTSKILKEIANSSEENLLKLSKTCFHPIHVTDGQRKSLSLCSDLKTLELCQEKKVYLYDMAYTNKNTYCFAQGATLPRTTNRNIMCANSVGQL